MRKAGCGMVSFLQDKLAMFGGYGIPIGTTQPGAIFTKNTDFKDGRGWSNELHVLTIIEGKWGLYYVYDEREFECAQLAVKNSLIKMLVK